MSTNFFLKGKSRKIYKRKNGVTNKTKAKKEKPNDPNLKNGHESSGSDLEIKQFSDAEQPESDHETVEDKKLRLAKKYLEEIHKEEAKRVDLKDIDEAIEKRLQRDYLQQKGKLRIEIAKKYIALSEDDTRLICAREHRLTLTCVCVSSDSQYVFSGCKTGAFVKWSIKEKRKLGVVSFKTHSQFIKGGVTSIALTTDLKFLATSDESNDIQIWDPHTLKHLHTFKCHTGRVIGLVFRKNTHDLYSASKDRSVKIWSLVEMAYVESLFGHQTPITSIDALTRERAITAGGRDTTVRIWKIVEESQLIFNGPQGSLDEVKLIDEEHFVSGSDNGTICLWSVLKKKPLYSISEAHGSDNGVPRWITSLTTLLNSDLFASGSYDNHIRLWKICDSYKKIEPMFSVEINGFVNSMDFTSDGKQLYAAVGQEHKSGRWFKKKDCKIGLFVINFRVNVDE